MASIGATNTPEPLDSLHKLCAIRANMAISKPPESIRKALRDEARALVRDLETDGEILTRTQWGLWETICLHIAVETGLMEALAASEEALSAESLSTSCNVELFLMQRLLRCLGSYGAVEVISGNDAPQYTANKVSRLFASGRGIAHTNFTFNIMVPGWINVPAKLKANNYRALTTATNTVYSDLRGDPDASIFDLLTPQEAEAATVFMPTFNTEHRDWLDVYPAQERLIEGAAQDREQVLFVDVGGASGSQAAGFRRKFPDAPGRVIVQDLAQSLRDPGNGIEAMAHDFFTPQVVHGARAYYLRYVMHDWSHEDNVKILTHLRQAMKPGYSRLLINEWLMPEKGSSTLMTSQDLNMMVAVGGEERPEHRHRLYIEAAGLKITGIWDLEDGISEAVIECEPA